MKQFIYFGKFPAPYGGVTIKNKLIFDNLSKHIDVKQSRFFEDRPGKLVRIYSLIIDLIFNRKKPLILGVSKDSLKRITIIMYYLNKKLMSKSTVMVMGGTFPDMVEKDSKLKSYINKYKFIYVETEGMKKKMQQNGVKNARVFPNCRENYITNNIKESNSDNLKCVFFSLISEEKGADLVVDAFNLLSQSQEKITVDFYGHIDREFEKKFLKKISSNIYMNYKGIFKANQKNDVYEKLKEYDLLLFPTKWKNEGVPGILVESKIAGIPAIVSDINYNSEIVEHEKSGVVLVENNAENVAKAIKVINIDRVYLKKLKVGAKNSSEKYIIDNFINEIIEGLIH